MAITLLGSAFTTASGAKTVTATPAINDLVVIVTAHTGNTSTTAPTDDQGGTYSQVGLASKASSADTMQFWVRNDLIRAASSTIFSHSPGTSSGGGLVVLKVTGMSRCGITAAARRVSGTVQFGKQDNQSASTPAPALPAAALTGNAVIGAVFSATNSSSTQVPPSGWTERFDNGYNSPTTGLEVCSRDSGETGTTITWGGASGSAFCSGVFELDTSSTPVKALSALGVG